jgi:hypothetical protein
VRDVIYDIELEIENSPATPTSHWQDLLVPIFRQGQLVYQAPDLQNIREFCWQQAQQFIASGHTVYPVILEPQLHKLAEQLTQHPG